MKIAIIGSGISGLTCGYLLHQDHQITLFEANDYIGGHTHTVDVMRHGHTWPVDTGFIVFNDRTYPLFLTLLKQLNIPPQPTEMSFSVRNLLTGLEYNGHDLNTLFAQRSNLFRPSFYRLISEILHFNRLTKTDLANSTISQEQTLGEYLSQHHFSDDFCEHYILPMGAAIWSASLADMRQFPVCFFLRFFNNHGLLSIANRPQWYVIPGGSREYIAPLTEHWRDQIHLSEPVGKVQRFSDRVDIQTQQAGYQFDAVIFACHSDQALSLLADPSGAERDILGAIGYRGNQVTLHNDVSLLPKAQLAHASWNYLLDDDQAVPAIVTYDMNRLQSLIAPERFCVTLNTDRMSPGSVIQQFKYSHPVYTQSAIAAQQLRASICGQNRTHFCGAYWYNGFHEDGVRSANDVCKRFGTTL
jgi:predicted NAD/FAD-binding protein